MNIASITFLYDDEKNVEGYTVYVDGKEGNIQSFAGQVILSKTDLDLSFISKLVQDKIIQTFSKEQPE